MASYADFGFRVVTPAEVFKQAARAPRTPAVAKPKPAWARNVPWFSKYLDKGVDAGLVGEQRVLVVAASRLEACRAFGIPEAEMPKLRFYDARRGGEGLNLRGYPAGGELPYGQFHWTPDGYGLILLRAGRTLMETASTTVHEACHAYQARRLGGIDLRRVPQNAYNRHEREAHACGESFTEFLERCYDVYDCKRDEARAVSWAKRTLFSARTSATWTAPGWMKNDG